MEHEKHRSDAWYVEQLLEQQLFTMHFQPIVGLRSQSVFAQEALCRPQDDHFESPVQLINAAVDASMIGELGRAQRKSAVAGCHDTALFLNLEPHEFDEPWLVRPDDPIFKHRHPVFLEITENVPLKFFDQCHSILSELRKKGILLAIDDFGAGFSNVKYIAELEPDIVKLDRELIQGCSVGTSEFSLLQSITHLCHEMRAQVVAEGIETLSELEAAVSADVDFAQGYLLARPAASPPLVALSSSDWQSLSHRPQKSSAPESERPGAATPEQTALANKNHGLQNEVERLTELLMESESARLNLVRKVREQSHKLEARPATPESLPVDDEPEIPESGIHRKTRERRLLRHLLVAAALVLPLAAALVWVLRSEQGGTAVLELATAAESPLAELPAPAAAGAPGLLEVTATPAALQATFEDPEQQPPAASIEEEAGNAGPSPDLIEITARLTEWARTWSEQRTSAYLSFYSLSFAPDAGEDYRDWAQRRRERIEAPEWIQVEILDTAISFPAPDRAHVRFQQRYSSPTYSDEVVKVLEWVREDSRWRILSERTADS